MKSDPSRIRCVIHGSFGKHFDEIQRVTKLFTEAGIEVIAPKQSDIVSAHDGFALLEGEENMDPRLVELMYLHRIKELGSTGFSYFVDPEGYIGKSASYELGIAQLLNVRCFFMERLSDHPAYVHRNSIWSPERLVEYVSETGILPEPQIKRNEMKLHRMWQELVVPGSVVAAGAVIEYDPGYASDKKEILLVKTHKWGGRYSMVGGKVRRNERLADTLARNVREETGMAGEIGRHICTFDSIRNAGYYQPGVQHIFVDNVVKVTSKRVQLNEEAQDYLWTTAEAALAHLDIEPNARHTIELYADMMGISPSAKM
jgi:ADP-ribose pyrophosphatase YjhB (NUDIX family)